MASSPPPSQASEDDRGPFDWWLPGASVGAKAGVLIVIVAGLTAVVYATRWVFRRWRQQRQEKELDEDEILGVDAVKELFFFKSKQGVGGSDAPAGVLHAFSDEEVWIKEESRRRYQAGLLPPADVPTGAAAAAAARPCPPQSVLVITGAIHPSPEIQEQASNGGRADLTHHAQPQVRAGNGGAVATAPAEHLLPPPPHRELAARSLALGAWPSSGAGIQHAKASVSTVGSTTLLLARDAHGNAVLDWGSAGTGVASGGGTTDVPADTTPTRHGHMDEGLGVGLAQGLLVAMYGGGAAAEDALWLQQHLQLREQQALALITRVLCPGEPGLEQRLQAVVKEVLHGNALFAGPDSNPAWRDSGGDGDGGSGAERFSSQPAVPSAPSALTVATPFAQPVTQQAMLATNSAGAQQLTSMRNSCSARDLLVPDGAASAGAGHAHPPSAKRLVDGGNGSQVGLVAAVAAPPADPAMGSGGLQPMPPPPSLGPAPAPPPLVRASHLLARDILTGMRSPRDVALMQQQQQVAAAFATHYQQQQQPARLLTSACFSSQASLELLPLAASVPARVAAAATTRFALDGGSVALGASGWHWGPLALAAHASTSSSTQGRPSPVHTPTPQPALLGAGRFLSGSSSAASGRFAPGGGSGSGEAALGLAGMLELPLGSPAPGVANKPGANDAGQEEQQQQRQPASVPTPPQAPPPQAAHQLTPPPTTAAAATSGVGYAALVAHTPHTPVYHPPVNASSVFVTPRPGLPLAPPPPGSTLVPTPMPYTPEPGSFAAANRLYVQEQQLQQHAVLPLQPPRPMHASPTLLAAQPCQGSGAERDAPPGSSGHVLANCSTFPSRSAAAVAAAAAQHADLRPLHLAVSGAWNGQSSADSTPRSSAAATGGRGVVADAPPTPTPTLLPGAALPFVAYNLVLDSQPVTPRGGSGVGQSALGGGTPLGGGFGGGLGLLRPGSSRLDDSPFHDSLYQQTQALQVSQFQAYLAGARAAGGLGGGVASNPLAPASEASVEQHQQQQAPGGSPLRSGSGWALPADGAVPPAPTPSAQAAPTSTSPHKAPRQPSLPGNAATPEGGMTSASGLRYALLLQQHQQWAQQLPQQGQPPTQQQQLPPHPQSLGWDTVAITASSSHPEPDAPRLSLSTTPATGSAQAHVAAANAGDKAAPAPRQSQGGAAFTDEQLPPGESLTHTPSRGWTSRLARPGALAVVGGAEAESVAAPPSGGFSTLTTPALSHMGSMVRASGLPACLAGTSEGGSVLQELWHGGNASPTRSSPAVARAARDSLGSSKGGRAAIGRAPAGAAGSSQQSILQSVGHQLLSEQALVVGGVGGGGAGVAEGTELLGVWLMAPNPLYNAGGRESGAGAAGTAQQLS